MVDKRKNELAGSEHALEVGDPRGFDTQSGCRMLQKARGWLSISGGTNIARFAVPVTVGLGMNDLPSWANLRS